MKIVFASYVHIPEYDQPLPWIQRTQSYGGILQALAKKHQVISIEQINYEGEYEHSNVRYMFLKLSKTGRRIPFKLHRHIKSLQPDVVFIHGLHFPLQVIQLRWALGSKVKIMVQHHAERPFAGGIKKWLQKTASRFIDAYLFTSVAMGTEWVDKGNLRSARKIHGVMEISSIFGPIDKELALARTGMSGYPVYLWVGRLNANKDPLTVVNGFLRFAKLVPAAMLYMVYQTEELLPDIIELIDRHPGQSGSIILVGKIPHDELLYWFNSADVIISGSHYEGSGTVICEAMSCGCIPVVTDIPSFRMMTDNGICGLLYTPGDVDGLTSQLMCTTHVDMAEKGAIAVRYYKANLSFEAIAARIEHVAASL